MEKMKKSIKIYPIFYALSADLIFFIPIDTLFLTLVKDLNASQISAMIMISLLSCIVFQKLILKLIKKIGNTNAIRIGAFMLLLSSIILTFGKSFIAMIIYRTINELAFMFWNMTSILIRNNLIYLGKEDEYYIVRNKAKVMYGITTMITALIVGYLFNIDKYLPMYISIIVYFIIFIMSFEFKEAPIEIENEENKEKENNKKMLYSSTILYVILSNAIFYSIIKLGQNNSKLFMQYDFQKVLSTEMVTYYITTIVFVSRIVRIAGNVVFGKLYLKMKDKMSVTLTILECMSFLLLILGHYIEFNFAFKVLMMSMGFCLILAIRDSFQVYIEDRALKISKKEEQQNIITKIEVYRKFVQLLLSITFTLVLMRYELIVVETILLSLSVIEVILNKKMCKKLKEYEISNEERIKKEVEEVI